MTYDPIEMISKIDLPILILHGDVDIQIPVHDTKLLHERSRQSKLVIFQNLNHILKEVKSHSRQDNLATYSLSQLPIKPVVIKIISDFINAHQSE